MMVDRLNLDPGEPEAWERAAEALHIPFSPALGIHPQDEVFLEREVWDLEHTPPEQRPLLLHFHPLVIYRYQVLKQADVVLALFLQGNHFSAEDKLADFEYYDPLTTGDSTLSAVVQSILAAEVGYQDLALEYFRQSIFVDLADLHHNAADGVHVASAGGVWTALVAGFGGMRDHFGELSFDPRLPADWPELSYTLHWHGRRLRVTLTTHELSVKADEEGEPLVFSVRGEAYALGPGEEVVVPLDGQGPVIPGKPSLRQFADVRREDGTLLSASVPTVTTTIPIIGARGGRRARRGRVSGRTPLSPVGRRLSVVTTALYRRYRPEAFGEMIGQSQVTEPLMTALRGDRVGHAYLFSGPRGCGKTTSARILARCLNCAQGPTDTPCGVCDSCVELGRGGSGSLDVVEIDAASHNGVDDARDLRERAVFAPARDRFKIFILDEAHMVTPQGFNALLKLVEEPPDHVKFIFATTEPEKVIGTIRSRTHHYPFRLVPPAAMLEYVEQLCETEGVSVEAGVLPLVVRGGGGSPRDTLSLLDQLIAGSDVGRHGRRPGAVRARGVAARLHARRAARRGRRRVRRAGCGGRVRRRRPRRADGSGSSPLRRRPARAAARPHRRRRDRPGCRRRAARRLERRPRPHDPPGRTGSAPRASRTPPTS